MKRQRANIPPGAGNPVEAAIAARDTNVMDMVAAAVKHNELFLAYQPVVQARSPGTVAFYESLIRVTDSTGRMIPARDFITQAEQNELGRELDCAALRQGLRILSEFRHLRLSVNMSARSIGYRKWMRILDRGLRDNPHVGERLILEISENSAMIVPELVTNFMTDMQGRGISFALDEYGAGHFATHRFRQFLFDAVKIDGRYVRGLHKDPGNQMVVTALMRVAQEFGMFTVAGSVERTEDAEYLASIGIDCLQGFFFGAPSMSPPLAADRPGTGTRALEHAPNARRLLHLHNCAMSLRQWAGRRRMAGPKPQHAAGAFPEEIAKGHLLA